MAPGDVEARNGDCLGKTGWMIGPCKVSQHPVARGGRCTISQKRCRRGTGRTVRKQSALHSSRSFINVLAPTKTVTFTDQQLNPYSSEFLFQLFEWVGLIEFRPLLVPYCEMAARRQNVCYCWTEVCAALFQNQGNFQ